MEMCIRLCQGIEQGGSTEEGHWSWVLREESAVKGEFCVQKEWCGTVWSLQVVGKGRGR